MASSFNTPKPPKTNLFLLLGGDDSNEEGENASPSSTNIPVLNEQQQRQHRSSIFFKEPESFVWPSSQYVTIKKPFNGNDSSYLDASTVPTYEEFSKKKAKPEAVPSLASTASILNTVSTVQTLPPKMSSFWPIRESILLTDDESDDNDEDDRSSTSSDSLADKRPVQAKSAKLNPLIKTPPVVTAAIRIANTPTTSNSARKPSSSTTPMLKPSSGSIFTPKMFVQLFVFSCFSFDY
jgi:hypothetical protein